MTSLNLSYAEKINPGFPSSHHPPCTTNTQSTLSLCVKDLERLVSDTPGPDATSAKLKNAHWSTTRITLHKSALTCTYIWSIYAHTLTFRTLCRFFWASTSSAHRRVLFYRQHWACRYGPPRCPPLQLRPYSFSRSPQHDDCTLTLVFVLVPKHGCSYIDLDALANICRTVGGPSDGSEFLPSASMCQFPCAYKKIDNGFDRRRHTRRSWSASPCWRRISWTFGASLLPRWAALPCGCDGLVSPRL